MKKNKLVMGVIAAAAVAALALGGCSGSSAGSTSASTSTSTSASASASASASTSASTAASASTSASGTDVGVSAGSVPEPVADAMSFVVGFDAAYPPYGFVADDGTYTGFDLDLAAEVATRQGWDFQAEPIDWDAKDVLIDSGTIDCIWNGFTMEGREDSYTFSAPYMLNEQVIVVKSDSGISSLADLAGKTVMTQVDSAALDVLSDEEAQKALADTFGDLQTISDYNNAFLQLDSGAVDAVACDLSIAQYFIAQTADKYLQLDEPLSSEHYAVGFKLGDTARADAVTATLTEMYADGTVAALCDKYADYGLSFDNWILK